MLINYWNSGRRVFKAAVICFTKYGYRLADRLTHCGFDIQSSDIYAFGRDFTSISGFVQSIFHKTDVLIFLSASGIAVRSTAPLLKDKASDPAVIVIDDRGRFVIPLLSGHIGCGNLIARELARPLGAIPVITTSSDSEGSAAAFDLIAQKDGFRISSLKNAKLLTAARLAGNVIDEQRDANGNVRLSAVYNGSLVSLDLEPLMYVIGIGCKKNTDINTLISFILNILKKTDIKREDIFKICSIDLKAREAAIQQCARELGVPFTVYTAEELNAVEGEFNDSDFVKSVTGTDSVCERSALAGCGASGGTLVLEKTVSYGMTAAIARRNIQSLNKVNVHL